MSGVSNNRYGQYKATLKTFATDVTPQLNSIVLGSGTYYPTSSPSITNQTGVSYKTLSAFSATLGSGNVGTVTFQISNDGTHWYYFDGSIWKSATVASDSNSASLVNSNISSFPSTVGIGSFWFKAFLNSSGGTQAVELQDVTVSGTN